jgi:hypothetical protein
MPSDSAVLTNDGEIFSFHGTALEQLQLPHGRGRMAPAGQRIYVTSRPADAHSPTFVPLRVATRNIR